jgi:TPR repeat protein
MKRTIRVLGLIGCVAAITFGGAGNASEFETAFIAAESGDYRTAAAGWDRLAHSGNAEAQFNLGLIYHSGAAGPIDEAEAVRWYQAAAENGYSKAQEFLAVAYREGWFGLPRDAKKSDYWIKQLEHGM